MLTQDPIGLAGGVNLYSYAGNNPIAFSDPFGLCPPEWLCRLAHFSAGFGDAVSFGLTDLVRDAIDANSAVDKGSGSYVGGFVAGMAVDAALGSAMAAEASASRASESSTAARISRQASNTSVEARMRLRSRGEWGPTTGSLPLSTSMTSLIEPTEPSFALPRSRLFAGTAVRAS
ncbi:MAG: hypothetical protein IPL76_10145 [Gemmatimonadetes bacterium]|nr:hypothetical protein [Gemmatimonadota bacterium]